MGSLGKTCGNYRATLWRPDHNFAVAVMHLYRQTQRGIPDRGLFPEGLPSARGLTAMTRGALSEFQPPHSTNIVTKFSESLFHPTRVNSVLLTIMRVESWNDNKGFGGL